jgi:hypothetical protein
MKEMYASSWENTTVPAELDGGSSSMAYAPQRSKGLMSFLPEKYVYIPIRSLFVDPKTAIMFINYIINALEL